jgi:hypothetical protein
MSFVVWKWRSRRSASGRPRSQGQTWLESHVVWGFRWISNDKRASIGEPGCEAPRRIPAAIAIYRARSPPGRVTCRASPSRLLPTSLARLGRDDRRRHRDLVILSPGRPDGPPQLEEVGIEVLDVRGNRGCSVCPRQGLSPPGSRHR